MKKENDIAKIFTIGCSSIFTSAGILLLMTQMILPYDTNDFAMDF